MKQFLPLLSLLIATAGSAQQAKTDSLSHDSLLRVGYERCAVILAMHFDSCSGYDHGYLEEDTCIDVSRNYKIISWGAHTACCDQTSQSVYDHDQLVAVIHREHSKNQVCFYVDGKVITATWEGVYTLAALRIISAPGSLVPSGAYPASPTTISAPQYRVRGK